MKPYTPTNEVHLMDVVMKKKNVAFIIGIILLIWFINLGHKRGLDDYLLMKKTIEKQEYLLREMKSQILERLSVCHRSCLEWQADLPVIYVITPTYKRPVQKAELTRLSQTLMLVNNVHWIIVEDSKEKTDLVENLLTRSSLNYTHLFALTPSDFKRKPSEPYWYKPRGVLQRNTALKWLRENRNPIKDKGVVFFADDDNTYSVQIFDEMRKTRGVSVWPVGLVGGLMVERPLIDTVTGKVTGFNSAWRPDRPFPIDMAGFAINLSLVLLKSQVAFAFNISGGFQESFILKQLITIDELEPLADNCTKVLVWHTRTEAPKLTEEDKLIKKGLSSYSNMEV